MLLTLSKELRQLAVQEFRRAAQATAMSTQSSAPADGSTFRLPHFSPCTLTFTICLVLVSWLHKLQRKRRTLDSFPAQGRRTHAGHVAGLRKPARTSTLRLTPSSQHHTHPGFVKTCFRRCSLLLPLISAKIAVEIWMFFWQHEKHQF